MKNPNDKMSIGNERMTHAIPTFLFGSIRLTRPLSGRGEHCELRSAAAGS